MSAPSVAVVILHWGEEQLTQDALDSLYKSDYPEMRVVLVDQGLPLQIRLRDTDTLLHLDDNVGFCAGNNRALEHVLRERFDYALLLNNDTLVEPDAIQQLVATLETDPAAAAAGPTVLYESPRPTIWYGGGEYVEKQGRSFHLRKDEPFVRTGDKGAEPTSFIPGCAILIRTSVLRSIGLLDERYYMYWEDTDWCVRALAARHGLLHMPTAVIIHRLGEERETNSPRRLYYYFRNRLLFIRLHTPSRWRVRAWLGFLNRLSREVVKVATRYRAHRLEYLRMFARSVVDNARRRYGELGAK